MRLTFDELDASVLDRCNLSEFPVAGRDAVRRLVDLESLLPMEEVVIPPGIPQSYLEQLPLGHRARYAVETAYRVRDEVSGLSHPLKVRAMLGLRGVGITTCLEVICVLESAGLPLAQDEVGGPDYPSAAPNVVDPTQSADELLGKQLHEIAELIEPLQQFSSWALSETEAESIGTALEVAMSLPEEVPGWGVIADSKLADISAPARHPYELLDAWAVTLNHRQFEVFWHRIGSDQGTTLEELGKKFAVTRERVRQIEGEVRRRLDRFLLSAEAAPIRWRARTLRSTLGVAAPKTTVSALLDGPPSLRDYREVLLDLAGPYEEDAQWLVLASLSKSDPAADPRALADEYGRIDIDEAAQRLSDWGLAPELHRNWLARHPLVREFYGNLVVWGQSIGERMCFALADIGNLATIDELIAHVGEDRERSSVQNAVGADPRIIRVDRTRYELTVWGNGKFTNIAESIRDLIRNAGQPLPVHAVVEQLSSSFDVAENSVRAYASAPMFIVEDGKVRERTEDEPFVYPSNSLRRAQGVYRLGDRIVALLKQVDHDMLRGSGSPLGPAAGSILDIAINGYVTFSDGESASVAVTFPDSSIVGPYLGSVRSFAERLMAREGDYLTLILDHSDSSISAHITRVHQDRRDWDLVAQLTGIDADGGLEALANALDCHQSEVRSVLRTRGDEVLLEALPIEQISSELASALDELGNRIAQGMES